MKKHLWKKRIGNIVVRMRRVMATPRAEATKPKQTVIFLFFFFFFVYFHNNSHLEMDLDIADMGEIKLTNDVDLGDLELGRIGQKYILDPELHGILSRAVLDADKMIRYQDQELFLITSVVYSEKFEVVGQRRHTVCKFSPPSVWMTFCVCFDFHIIRLFPAKMVGLPSAFRG